MQTEIARLREELSRLDRRERGLLGEVERFEALSRLRAQEELAAALELETLGAVIDGRTRELERLERQQAERRGYLAYRVRETYKAGPVREIRRALTDPSPESYLSGLRYAVFLGEHDARLLREYRDGAVRVRSEREVLLGERERLEGARGAAAAAREALARSRIEKARLLESIRRDRGKHEEAISDLERASRELGSLVERLGGKAVALALDVRKFRGLLDWPVAGRVSAGFGDRVHPRFRTVVRHPGLDLEAGEGTPFQSVFDGRVLFAAWLHGYGLTAIVDHGSGVVSVYAHASALLAEAGQDVLRGQAIGRVGDTGSLRGPYLYFEIRESGRPVDPSAWLRRR